MMDGKTVIVTGANRGIGKETAKKLAMMGARVVLACRNLDAGKQVADKIVELSDNKNVVVKQIDISSQQSIREFAEDFNKTEPRLDVLIHNAGVCLSENSTSVDGLELTMATNHFGPFLLTHLLIDILKKSAPSRIVVVSSITHYFGMLNFHESNYIPSYIPAWNYFNSKLANNCFTVELSRRLRGSNVTVNCVHPGLIDTPIWNGAPTGVKQILQFIGKMIFQNCEEGCKTIVYLASSEDVTNVTGKYFVNCEIAWMSHSARNEGTINLLWKISKQTVKLKDGDPKI